jgi:hypothetical protein
MNKVSFNPMVSLSEIILSVSIFVVAGIIMLNCFAIARYTQIRANDKAMAGAIVQSDFEIIKSFDTADEMHEFLNNSYESNKIANNTYVYTKYYDENWNQNYINKEYAVTVIISDKNSKSGNLVKIKISAEKEKPYNFIKKEGTEQIYSIESKRFFPVSGGSYGE